MPTHEEPYESHTIGVDQTLETLDYSSQSSSDFQLRVWRTCIWFEFKHISNHDLSQTLV